MIRIWVRMSVALAAVLVVAWLPASSYGGTTYDPTAAYQAGWTAASNPNGVWSYGFSSSATSAVTLYDTATTGAINGGNEEFWIDQAQNINFSPSFALNNGPAIDNGNIDFLANELVLVFGTTQATQYCDLTFTAPASGFYSVDGSFRGDQHGVDAVVGIAQNSTPIFSSSVSSVGQVVPFDDDGIFLNAGDTVTFSVGPNGGLQNTGLTATITAVPEPAGITLISLGAFSLLRRKPRAA
jgi:hypothetical protein